MADRARAHLGRHRRRRQGHLRRNLRRRAARQLLHRGARRADRQGSLEVLHRARRQRCQAPTPGAALRRRSGPTSTWGLARHLRSRAQDCSTGASPIRRPTRALDRHAGNIDAIPRTAPSDLYSNSTVALDPDTGKLAWYYQHLPGDDWDQDYTHERTLFRTALNPDPKFVKWTNPDMQARRAARRRGDGGRRRRRVRARPRQRPVPVGHAVPLRRPRIS